jgi:flagellar hook-associated protein 1 FlgK
VSLTSALNSAFSGLRANTRAANLVSTNIANATTENYGRRTLSLSTMAGMGGVRVDGVVRNTDPVLLADRWVSDAQLSFGNTLFDFATQIETEVGQGTEPGSLLGRVVAFENALVTASTNPASRQRLEAVAETADSLADALNSLSNEVQDARVRADLAISNHVTTLNQSLSQIEQINDALKKAEVTGTDTSALLDERQRLIDGISEIVPLRVVERDRGEIALFSRTGATLLDRSASVIEFTHTSLITPDMTLGGPLSGLTLNGNPVDSSPDGFFAGGDIAAQLEIRDVRTVARQAELDGIARELIQRMDANPDDTTIVAGDAGLFRDSTAALGGGGNYEAFDPADEVGIAQRIMLHVEQVRPGDGSSYRLRDGIYATSQGEVGDGTILQGLSNALSAIVAPQSASLDPVAKDFASLVGDFTASVAGERVRVENERTFLAARNTALKELELTRGVDTDAELQRLFQIEQHYAANAKVMSTVDDLMERLLSI